MRGFRAACSARGHHIKRRLSVVFLIGFLLSSLLACTGSVNRNTSTVPTSFREIPGVTAEEIAAIERLQTDRTSLTFGHFLVTESFMLPDGSFAGYTTALCALLSDLFGIPFEQRLYDDWPALLEAVDTRTVDFTGELIWTPERAEQYYMARPIAGRTMNLYVPAYADTIKVESDVNGKRLGFWENSAALEVVRSRYPALDFTTVEMYDMADAVDKLSTGEIDAFVMEASSESVISAYEWITSKPFFPLAHTETALTTADPALAVIVDVMNKYLSANGVKHLFDLYREGQIEYARYQLQRSFTEEERAWLTAQSANEPIRVAYETENYPICFYNENTQSFEGVAVDVLNEISRLTGLTFVSATEPDTRWEELLDQLKNGDVSMTAELQYTEGRKEDYIWSYTPYATSQYALISKSNVPRREYHQLVWFNVGTIRGSAAEELFTETFPQHSVIRYETIAEAIDALDRDEIDLFMMNENTLLLQTHYMEKPGYIINIAFDAPLESYFGFNAQETTLRSIVEKAQQYVDTAALTELWTNRVYDYEKKLSGVRAYYLTVLVVSLSVILCAVTLLLLKNRRLSVALKKSVSAAQGDSYAKSTFLARMSHDLRTSMNSIIGFSNLAAACVLPPEARDHLDNVRVNTEVLLHTVDDVLDITKIESGKMALECIPFELKDVARLCRTIILPRAAEKGLALYCYAEPVGGRLLLGDPTRLRQALINLLSNAVKFTNKGIVKLSVETVHMTDDRATLRFEVKDSGIGLSPEQLSHVFEPYKQADNSITRRYGGTGLGLSITKSIVEMMGGTLSADSTVGVGSRFSFTITFQTQARPRGEQAQEQTTSVSERPLFTGHVLVCEDNEMNQKIFMQYLSHAGLTVEMATNGSEGIDQINRRIETGKPQFDLIIMDIHMPVMDGMEALREISKTGIETPVIAVTANVLDDDHERFTVFGIHDLLSKPFTEQSLLDCIARYLIPVDYVPTTANPVKNGVLYKNYVENHRRMSDDIRHAIDGGDFAGAHRLAHQIKNLANRLEHTDLRDKATFIEKALSGGRAEEARTGVYPLGRALSEAIDIFMEQNRRETWDNQLKNIFDPQQRALIMQLDELLTIHNTDCLNFVDDLRTFQGTEALIAQIEAFDFEPARETLERLTGSNPLC